MRLGDRVITFEMKYEERGHWERYDEFVGVDDIQCRFLAIDSDRVALVTEGGAVIFRQRRAVFAGVQDAPEILTAFSYPYYPKQGDPIPDEDAIRTFLGEQMS